MTLSDDLPLVDVSSAEPKRRQSGITLQQLRIFRAVAHATTLTKAAKELGLAQPSLSQQISRLEATAGTQLFERRSNQMELTEAGRFLLRETEPVLASIRQLEDGITAFGEGLPRIVRIAGVNSVLRMVLPLAMQKLATKLPGLTYDVQENSPSEVVDMLYGRRINMGLVPANAIAANSVGFKQVPVLDDPYILIVPAALRLDGVTDPKAELSAADYGVLNSSIQFVFGTQRSTRIENWFRAMLPEHRLAAQCRTFEVAIGMVQAGIGVSLVPTLSVASASGIVPGVNLYRVEASPRHVVALVPTQYRQVEPYASMIEALQAVGEEHRFRELLPTPPFLERGEVADL